MAYTLKNARTGEVITSSSSKNNFTSEDYTNRRTVSSPSGKYTLTRIKETKYTGRPSPYFPAENQNANQSFFSRAGKTVTGGLKGSLAGNMDAMGVAYQAGQGGRTQRNTAALKNAQWAVARAKYAYDTDKTSASAAELDNALKQMKAYATVLGDGAYDQALKAAYDASGRIGTADLNKLYESLGKVNVDTSTGVQQKATKASRDLALQVQQSGSRDIEAAKKGVGTFGQMVIDAGASMAQMGGDLAVNALLGTPGSMMPFATRAFGGATMQAREGGGDLKQQIAYGAVQAGKEVLTEKMFNMALPFAKAYGGGALDDVTQRAIQTAVDKLGKTAAGKRALNAAFQLTASGVGEGLEELIGDWMEWQMPRIYKGDVDTAGETLANSLYDFVVGGMAGVAGSVISPDTYSYGRYAADVQQNTAPEMNAKAAEAVEAVTRGETITGNQAAAIARDPVAVEVLEQRTGVKLDTDKPISQVKRDIAGLASREVTQGTQRATPPFPAAQKRAEKRVGGFLENGQKAYQETSRTAEDAPSLYAGFSSVYNAGLNGIEADKAKGKYAAMLTPEQRYAAYNAGLEDARVQLAQENAEVASVTTTAGAGLADNEYSRYLIATKKDTAATLNAWGKKLGVRIEIVDQVLGGRANGQYIKEQNLIQIAADSDKPLLNVTAHEITHRMQDFAPNEYREFRKAALEYRMQRDSADTMTKVVKDRMDAAERDGVPLTQDEVMDEIAADFAGDMLDDIDLFERFVKDNRTVAQKLLDSLKKFIAKVKSIFTGKSRDKAAQEAYGKSFGELEAVAQKWQTAFDAAEQQARNAKTAAGESNGRMMLKDYSYDALVQKPDMTLAVVEDVDGLTRKEVIDKALAEAKKYGGVNQNGNVYVHVNDTDTDVIISAKALRHGLDRRFTVNAPATLKVGEILQNAVRVNELVPKLDTVDATYVLMGAAKNKNNEPYIVQFVVNRASNEVMSVDVLYAINAKTEPAGSLSPEITGVPATLTGSSISIADLLTYVNRYFPDVLPESVLRHFGHSERPAGKLGEGALFSLKAYSEAEKKDHVKSAKEFFGKTYSWNETGYITTDGMKLDFSGRHDGGPGGYRTVDHRDIRDALGIDYGGDDYSGAMVQFMGEGNIRISPESGGINLSIMPTKAQLDALVDFISKNRGEVILDLDDTNGNTVSSTEYPKGTHSSKVINDIRAYFENGTVPQVSELGKFRYQLRSAAEVEQEMRDLKKERTALASRNRALEQRVQDLKGEMRISKEPSVVLRDVKKLGLDTIRQYGSDVNYADIQSDMEALGKAVMKKDVSMADLMPYAKNAAKIIVENTSELTEYGAELLDIRDYLKQQHIRFNGDMAYYEDFRKSHMGTLKLSKTKGAAVDTVYAELTEMFGEGYFPSDVYTEADKLQQIADVIDNTDAIYANPFESYKDAAIQEIANDIIDGMISDQVRQKQTFADRKALEKQEAVGRVRNMLDKERQKRKDQVNKLRNQYAEKTAQGRESRKATARRAQIARHTGAMSNKLLHPTDAKHIPENLRVLVANLLKSINLESAYSLDENGRRRKSLNGDPTKRTQYVRNLQAAYNDIIKREGSMVVDPDLLDTGGLLDQVARLGGKRVADMNSSELEVVWKAIRAIEKTLTTYDKTLSSAKYQSTSEWAGRLAADSMSRKRRNRKLSLDMADPYTFFAAYGDAGMQVYRVLRNAQDQEHVMLMELQREAVKFFDKNVYENRFDRHTFKTGEGASLTLTTEQIMNLYNLARRGEQAVNHLMKGGIVQPEIKRNGKLRAIDRGTQNIPLTMEDIQTITAVLTPEQIKVAKGLQKLASSMLAEWGNNASMTVYGYRKFTEEHYWPIKAARDAVSTSIEKDSDNSRSIKNMGSAKALVPDASNALEIGGIYDVFAQNASDMIKYATLLAPMEDINRLYNFRYRDDKGNLTGRNVQQVLSSVYGDAAQKYWRNLMRDVQNGMAKNASDTTRAVERIVGNTKGAAVGANLRVVIQQPTAYFRAAVVLDPAYMAKGLMKGATAGNGWDKARQWAPIAGIKDTSGFDQGSRYTIAREVYGSEDGALEWLNDKSMALAGKADAVTWGKIWNACEWQVAAETSLDVGSDEFYRQVAAVFTDVIDQTQVVDGIMQRTQIMRDSDALTRQATSFMGEPLKSLNIFMRAYDGWVYENNPQKRSAALKKLKRSVAALVVTDVVNALAQSIVDGLRDDDKDKNWAQRILEAFTGYSGDEENAGEAVKNVALGGNLVSNMNPIGRIPYLKDILSILQGYTVDRMDAAAADDIIRTSKTFINGLGGNSKTTTAYNLKQVLVMGSKVFGISVGNMGRDMWSIARSIANDTGNVRFMFEMEKAIYRMDKSAGNRKRWCELLYRAQKDKDTETARLIYKEMLANGYEEKDVRMGVEAIMKKEQKVESVDDLKNRWRAP